MQAAGKSSENQSHDKSFSQSHLHSHNGIALHICFVLYGTLSHGERPLCAVHTSTNMENHVQITLWICAGWVASLLSTAAWFFVEEVDLICCELNSNVGDRPLPSETSALLVYNLGTSFVE